MHPTAVTPWMILPFAILLVAIAVMPLLAHVWWERHYPKVSLTLASITIFYYLGWLRHVARPVENLGEYFGFICLIGSLFIVSGGIHIDIEDESKPWANTLLLAVGGILANVIGTTGSSILLI